MAGASLGWALTRRSAGTLAIALVEAEPVAGYHTTGRSAAFWVESYGGAAIAPLSRASRGFLDAPPPGFADAPLLAPRPALHLAPPDDAAALPALAAELAAAGVRFDTLDRTAILGRAPLLRDAWATAAILEPDCHDIDVAALHEGFLRGAGGARPVLIRDARVAAMRREAGRWRLTTAAGEVTAATVVNAAGAWADGIAALAGARPLGLTPLRRTMAVLAIDPPPPVALPVVMDAGGGFYFKPDGARLWLSPHDETPDVAHDVRPAEIDLATVIDRFERAVTSRVVRLEHSWAGLRTFASDRVPVYGWDRTIPGFFWCAGQGGIGIQTAPAAGEMAAAMLLGEAPAIDPCRYLADRFDR